MSETALKKLIKNFSQTTGSPTKTLLRLLFPPLQNTIKQNSCEKKLKNNIILHKLALGKSDVRCAQKLGTHSVHVFGERLLDIPT